MLTDQRAYATLPTADLERLRRFYEDTLGFTAHKATPGGIYYHAGDGSLFAITRSAGKPSGARTQMAFQVPDIRRQVDELLARGVVFEQYDLPTIKTVDSVARMPAGQAAWFKDPDGNTIGMFQFDEP